MREVDNLLMAVLEQPKEPAPRLVLADWLEEQGDPTNMTRAELLRLQVEWEGSGRAARPGLTRRLRQALKGHSDLVKVFRPLLAHRAELLALGPALPTALMAEVAAVEEGPIQAGSVWVGHLLQNGVAFPTTLTIRQRKGNAIEGEMEQTFETILGEGSDGQFFFRGVVVARSWLMFVTYRGENYASWPGLYQMGLKGGGWLTGTWWLPEDQRGGELRLRRRREG